MKILKQLFCKHIYPTPEQMETNYAAIGWRTCIKCEKEKYHSKDTQFTHFKFN
jgi:hypothetical protein